MPFTKSLNEEEAEGISTRVSSRRQREQGEDIGIFGKDHCRSAVRGEVQGNTPEMNKEIEDTQRLYETLKDCAFQGGENLKDDEEFLMLLQSCIIYFDENNQYGYALKQTLPIGNYMWMTYDEESRGDIKPQTLIDILKQQRRKLEENPKASIVDFYACVNISLHTDECTKSEMQRGEEFNLLVRNKVPEVYNFTEKMLCTKRCEYSRRKDVFKKIPTYKKLISGVEPLKNYWVHSSILREALLDGWTIDKVSNTLVFTAQRVCEEYIQFNQDMRLHYMRLGMEFMALFHKLMNNGFYGWFCRAVKHYTNAKLLFSEASSYQHFENINESILSGLTLQQQASIVTTNPHDDEETKKTKIAKLFDDEIKKARRIVDFNLNFITSEEASKRQTLKRKREKNVVTTQQHIEELIECQDEAIRSVRSEFGNGRGFSRAGEIGVRREEQALL